MTDDQRLSFATTEDLILELMRRNDTLVIGMFDPIAEGRARCDIRAKGDLAWANLLVDNLVDFMSECRARFVTQRRQFTQDAQSGEISPDEGT